MIEIMRMMRTERRKATSSGYDGGERERIEQRT